MTLHFECCNEDGIFIQEPTVRQPGLSNPLSASYIVCFILLHIIYHISHNTQYHTSNMMTFWKSEGYHITHPIWHSTLPSAGGACAEADGQGQGGRGTGHLGGAGLASEHDGEGDQGLRGAQAGAQMDAGLRVPGVVQDEYFPRAVGL